MARRVGFIVSLLGLVLATTLGGDELKAQVPHGTACWTNRGICPINPAPIDSACRCSADPGRVSGDVPESWRNACQTPRGLCKFWFYPMGTPCRCGNDTGQIVNRLIN